MSDPLIGRMLLGRYRVVSRLAKGGMGVVYLARIEGAAGFQKPVVIKRILPELEEKELAQMFVREARILSHLRHPNIAGILDFAEEDEAHLMVLEYVHGYHLGQWRRYVRETRGRFDVELAIQVVLGVLDALSYAHRIEKPDGTFAEVIHRDVSPSNVLVDTEGQVKLVDFGVARMSGAETGLYKTEALMVKGKLPYVPPEQLSGGPPTPQGDVYACAMVLHELLVGQNEMRGADMADTVRRVLTVDPSSARAAREDVSEALDEILRKQLAKDPAARFGSAKELADALRAARSLSAEEAQARLLAAVREEYAAIPRVIGAPPLEERERSWRTPLEELGPAPLVKEEVKSKSLPPTVAESAMERPRRSAGPWIALAIVGLAVVAGGLVAALELGALRPDPEQVFVVQEAAPSPIETAAPAQEPSAEEPAEPAEPAEPPPTGELASRPRRGPSRPAPGEALGATFARHRAAVEGCLRTHAAQIEGAPELAVRFELAADGSVRRARVLPAPVDATPLGACLRQVAQSVRFAAQQRDGVSFRIPITVERR